MTTGIIQIQAMIYEIRGQKIMLDRNLAQLYGVETRVLKQAVNRNIIRFPSHFMFELTESEMKEMVSQAVIPSKSYFGGSKPYAFTEQGVAMLSAILKSDIAIKTSIKIMDAFVKLRKYVFSQGDTNEQIAELRKLLMLHIENSDNKFSEHSEAIEQIIIALNNLIEQPRKNKTIGFDSND
jgi:hypothetical protein